MGLRFASFLYSSREVPGSWSLVLFLRGCNFRCKHCHNWSLVLNCEENRFEEGRILEEVERNPFIDSVVLSGGEPSLRDPESVGCFIERMKEKKRLKVRIDTNGSRPNFLKELRTVADGFAVDIKSPLDDPELYSYTCGVKVGTESVEESMRIAEGMELSLFRTVRYPWLGEGDLERIGGFVKRFRTRWQVNPFFSVPSCPFNR